jgi:hypothetical protein
VYSKEQLDKIGHVLQTIKDNLDDGFDFNPNFKRSFVMAQKIGAILSLLTECEKKSVADTLKCSDENLTIAIQLTALYLCNAFNALELLPSKNPTSLNDSQQRLMLVLPGEFTRAEGVQIGVDNGLSQRAAYYAMVALEKKGLIKLQANGKYKKI